MKLRCKHCSNVFTYSEGIANACPVCRKPFLPPPVTSKPFRTQSVSPRKYSASRHSSSSNRRHHASTSSDASTSDTRPSDIAVIIRFILIGCFALLNAYITGIRSGGAVEGPPLMYIVPLIGMFLGGVWSYFSLYDLFKTVCPAIAINDGEAIRRAIQKETLLFAASVVSLHLMFVSYIHFRGPRLDLTAHGVITRVYAQEPPPPGFFYGHTNIEGGFDGVILMTLNGLELIALVVLAYLSVLLVFAKLGRFSLIRGAISRSWFL